MESHQKLERYHLQLPTSIMERVKKIALQNNIPIVDVIRASIKILLMIDELENKPNSGLYLIEGDEKTRIRPIF